MYGWAQISRGARPLSACWHQLDELSGAAGPVSRGLFLRLNGKCSLCRVDKHVDHEQNSYNDAPLALGANRLVSECAEITELVKLSLEALAGLLVQRVLK